MNIIDTNYGTKLPSAIKTMKLTGGAINFPIYRAGIVPYITPPPEEMTGGGLMGSLGSALKKKVGSTLRSKAATTLRRKVGAALKKKVGLALKKKAGVALRKKLDTALKGKVGASLRKKVGAALKSKVGTILSKTPATTLRKIQNSPVVQKEVAGILAPRRKNPLKARIPSKSRVSRSRASHNDLVRQAERMIYSGANF